MKPTPKFSALLCISRVQRNLRNNKPLYSQLIALCVKQAVVGFAIIKTKAQICCRVKGFSNSTEPSVEKVCAAAFWTIRQNKSAWPR